MTDGWQVKDELDHWLDAVIDCGECGSEPTTVVDFSDGVPVVARGRRRGPVPLRVGRAPARRPHPLPDGEHRQGQQVAREQPGRPVRQPGDDRLHEPVTLVRDPGAVQPAPRASR